MFSSVQHVPVFIRGSSGTGLPYSKGVMSQSLTAAGLVPERAYVIAADIERRLVASRESELSPSELHSFAIEVLYELEGGETAQRFRRWTILNRKDIPIIMLVGGATGSGKSTVASQVAHRLGITRITSTDLIRQVMRAFFSPALMPVLHHSSFDIPVGDGMLPEQAEHDLGLLGFIEQSRQVCVGAQAILERAERERMSTLIEGVHLVPGMVQHMSMHRCAVVEIVVHIEDESTHRSHFTMRSLQTDGNRPVDNYLRNFDRIRDIQEYLISQAQRRGVPVIENTYMDDTIRRLTDYTLDIVERIAIERDREAAAHSSGSGGEPAELRPTSTLPIE
jgi:2-phosphoglycerate kinase